MTASRRTRKPWWQDLARRILTALLTSPNISPCLQSGCGSGASCPTIYSMRDRPPICAASGKARDGCLFDLEGESVQPAVLQWFINHIETFAPAVQREERQQCYATILALQ